jgi:hypothetical protein
MYREQYTSMSRVMPNRLNEVASDCVGFLDLARGRPDDDRAAGGECPKAVEVVSVEALTDPLVRILRCAHNRPRKEQGTALPAGGQECQRSWPRARRQPSERKPHRAAGQRPRTHGTDVRKSPTTAEDAYYFDLSTARARPCLHRHPPCAQDPQLRGCASPGPATEETLGRPQGGPQVHRFGDRGASGPARRRGCPAEPTVPPPSVPGPPDAALPEPHQGWAAP